MSFLAHGGSTIRDILKDIPISQFENYTDTVCMRFQLVRTANEIPRRSVRISQTVICTYWMLVGKWLVTDLGLAKS